MGEVKKKVCEGMWEKHPPGFLHAGREDILVSSWRSTMGTVVLYRQKLKIAIGKPKEILLHSNGKIPDVD
jgi:hypothetical protein